ncbi:MAG: TlpA family protein disulfide reductase [Marinifilaceae bacterium]|jgi:thiol-disulfide isomerase/thioredoxin|nr:TlpA family protein disulfide reductase [Marinifilaceae bacterium]
MKNLSLILVTALLLSSMQSFSYGNKDKVKSGLKIGKKIPNITAKSTENKEISLYSIKDKLILVDFWASWCPPCRAENPFLNNVYTKYKDKKFKGGNGFTIYSFSLDKKKSSWIAAIKKDKLIWENHVSELAGWNSDTAYKFNIMSIPSNFLIDSNGIIIAKNLRGHQLEETLKKLIIK